MENRNFKIFVDFDGTITQQDVGEELFLKFGDADASNEIIKLWMDEKISSTQMWKELFKTLKPYSEDEYKEFIGTINLDKGFKNFLSFCEENEYEVTVVSDGYDYYIDPILKREKLDHLKVYSNKVINTNGTISPEFPYTDAECKDCANCKRNHVINHSSDEEFSIYIGDGYSDKCPAQFCDYIFAKRSLLKYCEKNRISYYPFTTFNDVVKQIEKLKNKNRLRKRHQALLKRRNVYLMG